MDDELKDVIAQARTWVPKNCRLFLDFDPQAEEWNAAVRLRHDYLGYLVHERAPEAHIAVERVRTALQEGAKNTDRLGFARASYFRQIGPVD